MTNRSLMLCAAAVLLFVLAASPAMGQCPEEPQLDNFNSAGRVVCTCFIEGEHAGAIFNLPASEFPIEILRVGVGWGSQLGGGGTQIEDSINIYEGGLPDPGLPVFELPGPELRDGFINEFDLEPIAGEIIINSSPFTVTLRFLNGNANNIFAPSVVHDGTICQPGQNIVRAIPGGWIDGCNLGIGGNWVFFVVYRKAVCGGTGSVPDGTIVASNPLVLERLATSEITLTWDASCSAGDDDYEIYAGNVGSYYSHFSKFCSTGNSTTTTFMPDPGNRYYLVVPRNPGGEGSYGLDGGGFERPTGGGACLIQDTIACP